MEWVFIIITLISAATISYTLMSLEPPPHVDPGAAEKGEKLWQLKLEEDDVNACDSGLLYKVLKEGDSTYHPTAESDVLVHYDAYVHDRLFDSNKSRGEEPAKFKPRQLVPGWCEVLQMMSEGDKWEVIMPPHLAYGQRGIKGKVPAESTLIFYIELVKILGEKTTEKYEGPAE